MSHKRNQRALAAIRSLREKQEKQYRQIDILCRDMVQAHGQFAQKLSRLTFVSSFYETLLGSQDLESLLNSAAAAIGARSSNASVAIVLLEQKGFDIHYVPSGKSKHIEADHLEQWFTPETVQNISLAGQICSIEKMLTLGMQASPHTINKINGVAIPLGTLGHPMGFVFLCKEVHQQFTREELESLAAIVSGLRIAVNRFRVPIQDHATASIETI